MDRGARRATIHGISKRRTWLSVHTHSLPLSPPFPCLTTLMIPNCVSNAQPQKGHISLLHGLKSRAPSAVLWLRLHHLPLQRGTAWSLCWGSSCQNCIFSGTSPMVQWLRLCAPLDVVQIQSLVGELRSHVPCRVAQKRIKQWTAYMNKVLLFKTYIY